MTRRLIVTIVALFIPGVAWAKPERRKARTVTLYYVSQLPNVTCAEPNLFRFSTDTRTAIQIRDQLNTQGLSRYEVYGVDVPLEGVLYRPE